MKKTLTLAFIMLSCLCMTAQDKASCARDNDLRKIIHDCIGEFYNSIMSKDGHSKLFIINGGIAINLRSDSDSVVPRKIMQDSNIHCAVVNYKTQWLQLQDSVCKWENEVIPVRFSVPIVFIDRIKLSGLTLDLLLSQKYIAQLSSTSFSKTTSYSCVYTFRYDKKGEEWKKASVRSVWPMLKDNAFIGDLRWTVSDSASALAPSSSGYVTLYDQACKLDGTNELDYIIERGIREYCDSLVSDVDSDLRDAIPRFTMFFQRNMLFNKEYQFHTEDNLAIKALPCDSYADYMKLAEHHARILGNGKGGIEANFIFLDLHGDTLLVNFWNLEYTMLCTSFPSAGQVRSYQETYHYDEKHRRWVEQNSKFIGSYGNRMSQYMDEKWLKYKPRE